MTTTGGCITTNGRTYSGSAQQPVLRDRAMVVSIPPAEIFTRTSLAIIAPVNWISFEKVAYISWPELMAAVPPEDRAGDEPSRASLGEVAGGKRLREADPTPPPGPVFITP